MTCILILIGVATIEATEAAALGKIFGKVTSERRPANKQQKLTLLQALLIINKHYMNYSFIIQLTYNFVELPESLQNRAMLFDKWALFRFFEWIIS